MNLSFGFLSPDPCRVCGGFKNNQMERRYGYVVYEDHQHVPPARIPPMPRSEQSHHLPPCCDPGARAGMLGDLLLPQNSLIGLCSLVAIAHYPRRTLSEPSMSFSALLFVLIGSSLSVAAGWAVGSFGPSNLREIAVRPATGGQRLDWRQLKSKTGELGDDALGLALVVGIAVLTVMVAHFIAGH